jgi:hypothetical protein
MRGGHAHPDFDRAISDWPESLRGVTSAGLPHTAWQLLEHLRIAQWDILEFSRDPEHVSPEWPGGYWPDTQSPPDAHAWAHSVEAFRRDRRELERRVADPTLDLLAPLPWGTGQTWLREALLAADHNAYHVGQLVDLRRALQAWPPEEAPPTGDTSPPGTS